MKSYLLATGLVALVVLSACAQIPSQLGPGNQNQAQTNDSQNTSDVRDTVPNGSTLDLSNQGLTKVSQNVFTQTSLEVLDVSGNSLTGALPAEIRQLQKLKVLDASDNQMTGVPAEVGQLQNLEVLDLSNNQLTGLPYELGNLKKLKTLNLSGNNYSQQDLDVIRRGLPADVNIIL